MRRGALGALALGGALASLTFAPTADAAFTTARCGGSEIFGRGASFQNKLHNGPAAGGLGAAGLAQLFTTTTSSVTCNGHPNVGYNTGPAAAVTGSGAGRGAMGSGESSNPTSGLGLAAGQRDNVVRYAGSDEGPTLDATQKMNAGLLGNSADDGDIHVVPIASSAVVSIVNYPKWDQDGTGGEETACPIPAAFLADETGTGYDRLRVPNARLENAWAGAYSTWGDFLPGLSTDAARPADNTGGGQDRYDAGCTNRKLIRAVRQDNSGTTFAWKDYLNSVAAAPGGSGTAWRASFAQNSNANRNWPQTTADTDTAGGDRPAGTWSNEIRYTNDLAGSYGDIADSSNLCEPAYIAAAAKPVCRAVRTGAEGVRDVTAANPGSIGYVDLATATKSAGEPFKKGNDVADTTYYMPMAEQASTTSYVEPTNEADGFKVGEDTGGAKCSNVPVRNLPIGSDPTLESGWDVVSQVYPDVVVGDPRYNACSLTYALAWDDNAPVYLNLSTSNTYAQEERRARAVKDYLAFLVSTAGQNAMAGNDYSPLPSAVPPGAPAGTVSVRDAAQTGVAAINWDKQGIGNQNTGGGGGDDDGGGGTTTGGGTSTPAATAPTGTPAVTQQTAPSNVFTIGSARRRGNALLLSFRMPGAGRLVLTARGQYTQNVRRNGRTRTVRRTVTVGRGTVNVGRAGDVAARLPISSRARTALRRAKRMTVTVTAVYTPAGGAPRTLTRRITLRR